MAESFSLPVNIRLLTLLKKNNGKSEDYPDATLELDTPQPLVSSLRNTRIGLKRLINGVTTETKTIFYNRLDIQTKMQAINPTLELDQKPTTIQELIDTILDNYGILLEEYEIETTLEVTPDNELTIVIGSSSVGWIGSVTLSMPVFGDILLLDGGAPFITDGGRYLANG